METRSLIKIVILVLLCLIIRMHTSAGQTLYSKGSRITVSPNTLVVVDGGVENEGVLTNRGFLNVSGQWLNSGVYNASGGAITFSGASAAIPQVIHHNGQQFNRVTIDGGGKKVILSDVVVKQAIRFEHGIVESSGDSRMIFQDGVTVTGASDSAHIHGGAVHLGGGSKLFPLGNGRMYLPVELTGVGSGDVAVAVEAFEFQNISLPVSASLEAISDTRYWHIDASAGALASARIVLPLRGESWIADPERAVVVQSAAPQENFISIGGDYQHGDAGYGRVTSERGVSMPFVALATSGEERGLIVFNAVSPNGDGYNDYLRIENIEHYPGNRLALFNRWGDKVFEISDYNNADRSFGGRGNIRGDAPLVSGTYFYVLDLPDGGSLRGFIAVKN